MLTNKTWTDAYRGAGRPEATYAIERMMDELAAELGVDPLEVREKNWIKHEEFPFTTVAGLEYDSGNYEEATRMAKANFGYDELRAEQKRRREAGDPVQLGIGVSTFTEMCGLAPSRVLGSLDYGAGGWEHASVRMLPTGKVEVVTGASAHGQGHETAFSQIVADRLGVPFEDVEVLHGDTQVAHKGMDTYGSRSLVVGGEALVKAADKVIEKAKPIAAHMLEANVDDIEFKDGRLGVRGTDQGVGIAEVAMAAFAAHDLPEGVEPSIDADATYDPVNFNYPHGTHLCAVEVDTETGQVKMRKYTCVDDIGNVINPLIVAGQVHGGLVQGIAQALWEEAVHDESGTLVSASFVDYLVPTAADTISFDVDHNTTPSTDQHARHQGRRRGGDHRLDPGRRQRGGGRGPPVRGQRHPDAVHPRARLEGDPCRRLRRRRPDHRRCGTALRRVHRPRGPDRPHGWSRPVIPAKFDYVAPTSVEEALSALAAERRRQGDRRRAVAAARAPDAAERARAARRHRRDRLAQEILDEGDSVLIGAMAPYYEILADASVQTGLGLLHKAITEVADPQIRHRGTLGGALVHADPAGDCGAPILALDAELVISGQGGERTVAAADFFEDLFETAVGEDEILTAIRVPEARRLGVALREVRAGGAPVADRGGGRGGQDRRRHDQRGPDRPGQHGLHRPAGHGHRAGTRRSAGHRGRRTRGVRPGGRGHQPALGPQRRRGLPQAPRDGADPTGGAGRGRRLSHGAAGTSSPSRRRSRRPGRRSTTSSRWPAASRAPWSPRWRGTRSRGACKVKLGPIALSTTAPARSWRRTSRRAGW